MGVYEGIVGSEVPADSEEEKYCKRGADSRSQVCSRHFWALRQPIEKYGAGDRIEPATLTIAIITKVIALAIAA